MVKKMQESDTENEIREAYRVFDKERTGCIAVSEMRLILSNLPEKLSEVRTLRARQDPAWSKAQRVRQDPAWSEP